MDHCLFEVKYNLNIALTSCLYTNKPHEGGNDPILHWASGLRLVHRYYLFMQA